MEFGVVVDERQVLALGFCKGAFHVSIVDLHRLLVNRSGKDELLLMSAYPGRILAAVASKKNT